MAKGRDLQLVVSSPASLPRIELPLPAEAAKYLEEAGWNKMSENEQGQTFWEDPAASAQAGVSTKSVSLPGRDGSDPVVVSQVYVPPASWNHSMAEAMGIQRVRDGRNKR